jgi:hypothetical protein
VLNIRPHATASLICSLLAACASAPIKPLPVPDGGNFGEVVVFREWAFAAGGVSLAVGVKDAAFVTLSNSEKVTARMAPGDHEFFVQARSAEPTKVQVVVRTGAVTCLRTSSSPSTYAKVAVPVVLMVTGYHFYLDQVPCPGRDELAKYKNVAPPYEALSGGR